MQSGGEFGMPPPEIGDPAMPRANRCVKRARNRRARARSVAVCSATRQLAGWSRCGPARLADPVHLVTYA